MTETIIGTIDLALVALYAFWIFFAALIFYLQRENMREGYPLVDEEGAPAANQGFFPVPLPKIFRLPFGRGEVAAPRPNDGDTRPIALVREHDVSGYPFEPAGDPFVDGVGPAAWAERRDVPELDGHGHPKIGPMRMTPDYRLAAGRDPRGLPVIAGDGVSVGVVSDMWVDRPEQMVRYLEIDLGDAGKRLLPMGLARVRASGIKVHSIYAAQFPGVPTTKSEGEVTLLEEDKISAWYCGGKLYADRSRLETQL